MVLLWIHRLLTIGGWWFFYDGGPPEPQKGRTPKGRTPKGRTPKAEPQKPAKRAKNGQKRANRPNYPPEKIQAPPTTDKGERWADSSDVATRARRAERPGPRAAAPNARTTEQEIRALQTTDKGERWADSSDVATRARKGGAARAESGRTERPNYGARDDTN